MMPLDQPGPVRPGEELDRRALETWLLGHVRDARGPLEVRRFPHGRSKHNYLLDLGGRELVLRRARSDERDDVGREYRLLASLHPAWGKVPEPLAYCPDPALIGAPFFVARRVRGTILRRAAPPGWNAAASERLAQGLVEALAELHRVDAQLAGLGRLGTPSVPPARQIEGWFAGYQAVRTPDSPDPGGLCAWLRRRLPAARPSALVHADFRAENLVLDPADPGRVLAVLDWELATLADPQLDVGFLLAGWVEAGDPAEMQAFGLTHLPGSPSREALLQAYREAGGAAVEDPVFLYVYGLLRLAGALQRLYARERRLAGASARAAAWIALLHEVVAQAERAIRRDRLSGLR